MSPSVHVVNCSKILTSLLNCKARLTASYRQSCTIFNDLSWFFVNDLFIVLKQFWSMVPCGHYTAHFIKFCKMLLLLKIALSVYIYRWFAILILCKWHLKYGHKFWIKHWRWALRCILDFWCNISEHRKGFTSKVPSCQIITILPGNLSENDFLQNFVMWATGPWPWDKNSWGLSWCH